MTHYLKIKPEYYQPLIELRKPFEIRKNDRNFKSGDIVELMEFLGFDYISACRNAYDHDCEGWEEIADIPEYGEEEAIDICNCGRSYCGAYYKGKYSGRICKIQIKEVFDLAEAGLENYVAFTFDILEVKEQELYTLAESAEEVEE